MSLRQVIADVEDERAHQDDRWGGIVNDDRNTLSDWLSFISKYTCKAALPPPAGCRRRLIQIAALAVAAAESCDRNTDFPAGRKVASDV